MFNSKNSFTKLRRASFPLQPYKREAAHEAIDSGRSFSFWYLVSVARKKSRDELEFPIYVTLPQMKLLRALTRRTQLAKKVEAAIERIERNA